MFSTSPFGDSRRAVTGVVIIVLMLLSNGNYVPEISAASGNNQATNVHVTSVTPNAAQTVNLTEWTVPSGGGRPWGIGIDPTGKIWFTENQSAKIGMLDPTTNIFNEWSVPGGGAYYLFLKQFSIGGSTSTRVYFTEYLSDKVGYFDNNTNLQNTFTEWTLSAGSRPVSLYVDENNDMWFTESGRDIIGELDPSTNTLIEWTLPDAATSPPPGRLRPWGLYVQPVSTFTGTNRFVWFTERGTPGVPVEKVGRLEAVSSRLSLFDISGLGFIGFHEPEAITVDPSGRIFFSQATGNRISNLGNTTNTVADYLIPTSNANPTWLTSDPSGKSVWFTEYNSGYIGSVNSTFPRQATLVTVSVCTIPGGGGPTPSTPCTSLGGLQAPKRRQCTPAASSETCSISNPSTGSTGPDTHTQNPSFSNLAIVNTQNGVTEYSLPTSNAKPGAIGVDTSGNVWFTESEPSVNKIARVQFITQSDFSVNASPQSQPVTQGQSTTFTVTVTQVSGTPLPVALSVNNPSALSAGFNPQTQTPSPSFTSTLTIGTTSGTAPGNYALTITAASSKFSHNAVVTVIVQSPAAVPFDFSITSVGQSGASIVQGESASYDFQITLVSGVAQGVSLDASGLPAGITPSFTDQTDFPTYTSTLTVQTAVDTAPGPYSITVTATGGGKSNSAKVTLTITELPRDFNVTASAQAVQLAQASQKSITINVKSIGVFQDAVSFTSTVTPTSSLTVTISPTSVTPPPGGTASVQMKIVAPRDVPTGSYTITVTPTSTLSKPPLTITVSVTGCLIATATYGSELAPEVQFLRDFRDFQITKTFAGSNFMTAFNAWYYSFSPAVAQYEYGHPTVRTIMKFVLYPLIGVLHVSSASYSLLAFQPELAALLAGMVASSLIGVVYLALPISGVLWLVRRRLQNRTDRRLAKWLTGLLIVLIAGFVISEIVAAPVAMMVVSAATVLTVLVMGSILPALRVVKFAKR